ncbi:MAG: histidine triad nucleotide-binding protein [Acidobacteria bacterium]|nr:MAG: histidine triad nucleotide-binding protein [Acidobacteriota bacterium]
MAESDCLFCKIVSGAVDAKKVHEDPLCVAFEDINPQAPVHVLIVPKKHVATLNDLLPEDEPMAGHLLTVAARIAKERGVDGPGYRTVVNCNAGAGQSVFHLHVHLLGGRSFGWPPG